jgi:hypothetical protein
MMRRALLDLHGALVEAERREYERVRGRLTDRAFLQALISDPDLAWLNPLTALIVRLEEVPDPADCVAEVRQLLKPDENGSAFQRCYAAAMQRSAEVVVAHGQVLRALA